MSVITENVFLPNAGEKQDAPEQFLDKIMSPYSRNIELRNERMQGRGGLVKFDTALLSGAVILTGKQYWKFSGSYDLIFGTQKDLYQYDFTNTRYTFLTPKYSVGKIRVENASTKIYGGLEVDNCDTDPIAWADGSGGDVTPSRNTTSPKDGTAFVRLTVAAGAGVELLAYHDITSVNLSAYDSVGFWMRSSVTTAAGDLTFVLDNTAACASPLETINIPVLTADTWTWVNLNFVTPGNLTAVVSIGVKQAVDIGACTIDIDQIVVGDWADQLGVGDFISIGTTYSTADTWYEVLTVDSDTAITLTAVYAGSTATQQAYNARLIFQGGVTNMWDTTQFVDSSLGNVIIATNGVDKPVYYAGTNQFAQFSAYPTGFTAAKYVANFGNSVHFAWTVESGNNQPVRQRWSAAGNFQSYDDLDYEDLDEPGPEFWINGLKVIGTTLYNFKEFGAYLVRPVITIEEFSFELSATFEGTTAAYSITPFKNGVYYFGTDERFHFWNGVRDDAVFEDIVPYLANIDPTNSQYVYVGQKDDRNQIRWLLPYDSSLAATPMIVYDWLKDVVEIWEYKLSQWIRSIGSYLNVSDLYVDDTAWADLFVDDEIGYWDDRTFLANAPVLLYGGADGYVYKADSGTDDSGTAYTRTFRTKRFDHGMPSRKKRLGTQQWWLDSEASVSVTVKIKRDDSNSFDAATKTITLTDSTRDPVKKNITWNKEYENAMYEVSSTDHFALQGFINEVFTKRKTHKVA